MNHLLRPLPFLLLIAACANKGGGDRTLSVHIGGGAGRTCYFEKFANNKPTPVDSIVLDADGKGTFTLGIMPLDFYGVAITQQDMAVIVLDSTESAELEATAGDLQGTAKVSGSAHSKLLYDFFAESKRFDMEKQELMKRVNADRSDTDAIERINKLNEAFYARCKAFSLEHKASPVALAAVSRLNIQNDMPVFQEVRDALAGTIPNSEYFIGFRDQVARMEQQLAAMKAQEEQMARLDNLIPVGSEAPDFTQPTPDGKQLSLSSLRGKVVLIDFWASWCKPCRMENPNVKRVYDQYKGKGFEILGVSLDREKGAWTQAIAQDGLPWKHVSDLAFWNNAAAQQYGVSSIPYTVLVDKDGKVLGKNLRGPALEEKLAEVFK
ncbi:MAG: TlpA disulfide reductase family protein [Flavobacteriales bacterium]